MQSWAALQNSKVRQARYSTSWATYSRKPRQLAPQARRNSRFSGRNLWSRSAKRWIAQRRRGPRTSFSLTLSNQGKRWTLQRALADSGSEPDFEGHQERLIEVALNWIRWRGIRLNYLFFFVNNFSWKKTCSASFVSFLPVMYSFLRTIGIRQSHPAISLESNSAGISTSVTGPSFSWSNKFIFWNEDSEFSTLESFVFAATSTKDIDHYFGQISRANYRFFVCELQMYFLEWIKCGRKVKFIFFKFILLFFRGADCWDEKVSTSLVFVFQIFCQYFSEYSVFGPEKKVFLHVCN